MFPFRPVRSSGADSTRSAGEGQAPPSGVDAGEFVERAQDAVLDREPLEVVPRQREAAAGEQPVEVRDDAVVPEGRRREQGPPRLGFAQLRDGKRSTSLMRRSCSSRPCPDLKWKVKARRSGSGKGSRVTAEKKMSLAGITKAASGIQQRARGRTTPSESMVTVFTGARACPSSGKSRRSSDAAASIGGATAASGASKVRPSAVVTTKPPPTGRRA